MSVFGLVDASRRSECMSAVTDCFVRRESIICMAG